MNQIFEKRTLLGVAIGAALTIGVLAGLSTTGHVSIQRIKANSGPIQLDAPPVPGTTDADYDWELTSLTGEKLALSSLKGQVIFVTLWSPECPYCVVEMGYIQELYNEIAEEGVAFVCATKEEYAEGALDFAVKRQFSMPLYSYAGELPAAYKYRITPAAFIIDRQGKIAWSHEGAARWNDEATVRYLRGLLIETE